MITAEELTKQRGGRAVVSDVTFRCEPGTSHGARRDQRRRDEPMDCDSDTLAPCASSSAA